VRAPLRYPEWWWAVDRKKKEEVLWAKL